MRVVRIALLLIPVSGLLNLVLSYLRAARATTSYAWLVAGETCGWLAVAATLLVLEGDLELMILGLLTIRSLILAVGVGLVLSRSRIWSPRLSSLGPYLRYGLPLLPLGVLNWVINASDRFFLSYFCEPEVVGIYAVSYGIGSIVGLAYAPVFFVLLPATAAAWSGGRSEEVDEYLRFAQKYPFLVAVPVVLLLTGYAEATIGLLATKSFAATPMLIGCVAMAIAIMNVGAIAQTVLNLDGRSGRILLTSVGTASFNIAANALAVPYYGAMGAAVTTLMTYTLQALVTHLLSRSVLPFPWAWRLMLKALLSALPLALCLTLSNNAAVPQPLLAIGGCAAYAGLLFASGVFEPREWRLVLAVINLGKGRP